MATFIFKVKYKLRYYWYLFLDTYCSKKLSASIADIIINHEFDDRIMVVVSRLLDIKNYYKGDKSFYYQNQLSLFSQGENYNSKLHNENFERLIESYQKSGYDNNSRIIIDSKMYLFNGTHRTAMNLFQNIYNINALLIPRKINVTITIQQYREGLPEVYKAIKTNYEILRERIITEGYCMCCVVDTKKCDKELVLNKVRKYFEVYCIEERGESLLVKFFTTKPDFKVIKHKLVSKKALLLMKELKSNYSRESFVISINSNDGKNIIDKWNRV